MSIWVSTHGHSTFSLLDGLSKPKDIAKRCKELGYTKWALTEHGNLGGIPSVGNALKEAGISLIRGNEFYVPELHGFDQTKTNRALSHLVVLAKNKAGWKQLIRATSESNSSNNFYVKPRLSLEQFGDFTGDRNLIAISGHPGSQLANSLLKNIQGFYKAKSYEEASACLHDDWEVRGERLISRYKTVFGPENFFVEIQRIDIHRMPGALLLSDCLRKLAGKTSTRKVATADSHYCRKEDAEDQRVLLCAALKTTFRSVYSRLNNDEDVALGGFFISDNYHIPAPGEMVALHQGFEDELENSVDIANSIESYDINNPPQLRKYEWREIGLESLSSFDYLKFLCERGMAELCPPGRNTEYKERYEYELKVINDFNLSDYFLIVADILDFVKRNGWLRGAARGSAAGSLVSYLVGITVVDPIEHRLYFERFLNAARGKKMPDIDIDIPASKRDIIVKYIFDKYGQEFVAQMVSFQTLKGREALSCVMRAHDVASFDEIKRMTKGIPDEAKIADKLEEMRKEEGESSIIRWALENEPQEFSEWVELDDAGNLVGPYAQYFEQAIRIEGSKKATSQHPAGVIVSAEPLQDIAPMIRSKDGDERIIGFEMNDAESIGLIKFDVLSLSALDKIMGICDLLSKGKINAG